MTYQRARTAEGQAAPFLMVEFQMGPELFYRYTDTEKSKTFQGEVWEPTTLRPEFPGEDGDLKEKTMKLEVQGDLVPALHLINRPPSFVCRVKVWEGNLLDKNREARLRFSGRVFSSKWMESGIIEITVSPASTELSLPGKPHMYQRTCPHVLYGSRCGASRNRRTVTAALGSDGIIRTSGYPTAFTEASSFSRGELSWTNPETNQPEYRTISLCADNGSGLDLYVNYPQQGVTVFKMAMGCTHTETACTDWHDNILNFGGQPWIPLKSPHQRYTEFY